MMGGDLSKEGREWEGASKRFTHEQAEALHPVHSAHHCPT